jgi:lysyl-tRNA synthetase class 2
MTRVLSEQELVRRESLQKLRDLGVDPYPADLFDVNTSSKQIKEKYKEGEELNVVIAGRLMSRRIMGKASFAELQDSDGKIQIYVNRDEICETEDKTMYNTVFKKLLDIGDIIGITGTVFITKVGEISVKVKELKVLTKSLRPLPLPKVDADGTVHDAFTDPEKRYRQRYVDLVVNPEVKDAFIKRTKLTNSMREFLNKKEYLEVETPILQPLYGGAAARPFKTHHNTLDMELYPRVANE